MFLSFEKIEELLSEAARASADGKGGSIRALAKAMERDEMVVRGFLSRAKCGREARPNTAGKMADGLSKMIGRRVEVRELKAEIAAGARS